MRMMEGNSKGGLEKEIGPERKRALNRSMSAMIGLSTAKGLELMGNVLIPGRIDHR